jgi:hypothetical protein
VRKLIIPIFVGCLSISFTLLPATETAKSKHTIAVTPPAIEDSAQAMFSDAAASLYTTIQLEQSGLSKEAFNYAWKGYQRLLAKKQISRCDYLTICDFSQSSGKKRLYVIDIINNKLAANTYVAHGRNSGAEYATKFSNKPESLQSSLGFYSTANTYTGEHGLSLRVTGLEPGFNDKAFQRAIVIHGASYIGGERLNNSSFMGRSYGCPALPQKESTDIINTIKNGTCLFIYHPSRNYLIASKILNG